MFGAVIPPLLGALGSYLGNRADSNARAEAQFGANQTNIQLSREQQRHNIRMWQKQNQYNHPSKQMARLKEAGLSPHLVYGNGSVANTAGDVQGYNKAEVKSVNEGYRAFENIFRDTNQALQTDNLAAQKDVLLQEAALKAQKVYSEGIDARQKAFDLGLSKELRDSSLEAQQANAKYATERANEQQVKADIARQTKDPAIRQEFAELESKLKRIKGQNLQNEGQAIRNEIEAARKKFRKRGINDSDNIILRFLMQSNFGRDFIDYFNDLKY